MKYIDLHTHTTASDGTDSPTELVNYALEASLSAIAITDHDTIGGIEEAITAAKKTPLLVIPGIEFSCKFTGDLHILGLFIDYKSENLNAYLQEQIKSRNKRNIKIINQLKENGFEVSVSDLDRFSGSIITKAHLAHILISKGYCNSVAEGISKFLNYGCIGYVPRDKITPKEAIDYIKTIGGISCLAHLNQIHGSLSDKKKLVSELKSFGLDALETLYPTYTEEDELFTISLCKEFGLMQSGGSDYHGANKTIKLNDAKVPFEFLEIMIKKRST